MRNVEQWLEAYGESHQNKTNKLIHLICVPAIAVTVIGFFWFIPVPEVMQSMLPSFFNFGVLVGVLAIVYYSILSISLALGMILLVGIAFFLVYSLSLLPLPLWASCGIIFAIAWIFQFIGHNIEGKKPSFLEDIQFLMIGPMWLLAHLYKKLGITY